jgi:hypothetical protein
MRLLLASMAALAACGSGGHGGPPPGGAGGGPGRGTGVLPDTGDALVIVDAGASDDAAVDAVPTFSCQVAAEAGGLAACIDLDPGYATPEMACDANGAGAVMTGACPRATSSGGCHIAETGMPGYTVWWYAPLGTGAVLSRCEQQGDSYVSP